MRNVRDSLPNGGAGDWRDLPRVDVWGDASLGGAGREAGKQTVAVLRVIPFDADFRIGWSNRHGTQIRLRPVEIDREGRFGMRVNEDDVTFFATSVNLRAMTKTPFRIELVDVTTADDPTYDNLNLI